MPDTFVVAPDKFKGSLTAVEAARAIERGVLAARPNARCELCPMADGGEGTVDVFLERGGLRKSARVRGPLGDPVDAAFALRAGTAVLEMSSASGMRLLTPAQYDPMRADTFGTGELVKAALDDGAKRLIVGVGGSATNDAGTGMLRALGVRFLDETGAAIEGPMPEYERLAAIDVRGLDSRLANVSIDVASDVDNPLCGRDGAARTFAAQKGADANQIEQLDRLLSHIADVAAKTLSRDCRDAPGAGAAGGLGFALMAFLGASVRPGVAIVADEWHLDELLRGAVACMTGEGKIDAQTLHGKVVWGVGSLARAHEVPTIAFAGTIDSSVVEPLARAGIDAVPIAPAGMPVEQSIRDAGRLLEAAARASAQRRHA